MFYTQGIFELKVLLSRLIFEEVEQVDVEDQRILDKYDQYLQSVSTIKYNVNESVRIINFEDMKVLSEEFYTERSASCIKHSTILKNRFDSSYFWQGLNEFAKQNSRLYLYFNFFIKVILIYQLNSRFDGTTTDTPGFISMSFNDEYTHQDFIELCIHQLTHMLLYLDNAIFLHVPKENQDKIISIAGAQYAAGGSSFPIYKAFHSFVVGVEIIAHRAHLGRFDYNGHYHGSIKRMMRLGEAFKIALLENKKLLSTRGRILIENAAFLFDKVKIDIKNEFLL